MFPTAFGTVSPAWLSFEMSQAFADGVPLTNGERRALHVMVTYAAHATIIKALPIPSTLAGTRVTRLLADLNGSWRDIALLGLTLSDYESAMRRLAGAAGVDDKRSQVELPTPLGTARALLMGRIVCALGFEETWQGVRARTLAKQHVREVRAGEAPELSRMMAVYFAGGADVLQYLLVLMSGTDFQNRVWSAVRAIPAGETRTYGELAKLLGTPSSARAVGAANGQNPLALLIPCHRLVGRNGALTGYAWGSERKRWLLQHERQNPSRGTPVAHGAPPATDQPNGERRS